ncbi:MAG: DUF4157 domain-containing protein, partial [Pyrinomonadaceae bacterium]
PASLGAGAPLGPVERGYFEPRLGRSLGEVRIHTGEAAAKSAASIGAEAYTLGNHIAFAADRYRPHTEPGRRLLAHELAHFAQGSAHDHVRPYRPVKQSEKVIKNYGAIDDASAGLVEKAAPARGDPVIETIHVKFDGNAPDLLNPGELLVTGTLTAKYRAANRRPDIVMAVTGGSTAGRPFGLTDRIKTGEKVHKIQGPGYNDTSVKGQADAHPAPKGEYSHYVKKTNTTNHAAFDFNSSMGLAVYFKGTQAIHLGSKTAGSHACIHVDWEAHKEQMRLINYHSQIGVTKVTIEYDKNAAFKAVCCAPSRMVRGFVNPCNVFSASDCPAPPRTP